MWTVAVMQTSALPPGSWSELQILQPLTGGPQIG